jgi:hypothetical protein
MLLSITLVAAATTLVSAQAKTDCEVLNGGFPSIPATGTGLILTRRLLQLRRYLLRRPGR